MKSNILKTVTLGLGLITFVSVNAQEAETKKDKASKFEKIDANMDGKINFEEYAKHRAEMRDKTDKEPIKGDYSKRFKQIDQDQDGSISKEEFKNRKETAEPKKEKSK